jgi:sulfatase maturation enzyme AslB (radical SAM superfamily)
VNKNNAYSEIAQDLKDILPTVKRINFTGGEPLLIKDNIKILTELLHLGRIDCEIMITTNASVINPQWLSLLSQFQTVHWTISIDGVGPYAEYIRYGSVWAQIEKNIKDILSRRHSVAFNTVLSSYSVLDIDNLVSFFVNSKKIAQGPLELMFHMCMQPKYLNPSVLDAQLSHNASIKIRNAIQLLSKVTDNPSLAIDTLENTLKILNTSDELLRAKFIEFTATVDRIRNQNFYKLTQGA